VITVLSPTQKNQAPQTPSEVLRKINAQCRNCSPITPFECINRCPIYKLKNELRNLWETMENPNYLKELLNVLKNKTRLQILLAITCGRYSATQLQAQLKESGISHSQANIIEEYLRPMVSVGLTSVSREEYYATTFGARIAEQLGCFLEFAAKLSDRSECYEEALLKSLLLGAKTFEEIEAVIPPKAVSRTLKRLRSTGLISAPDGKAYIFFYRSKRDFSKDTLTPTEQQIYDSVVNDQGTPLGAIAKKTGISKRRSYKIIKGLKGKKLMFCRRTPKLYTLTADGQNLAMVLEDLQRTVEAAWDSMQQVMHQPELTAGEPYSAARPAAKPAEIAA